MTYLLLSVLGQTFNALLLKIGELYDQDRMVVVAFNYFAASLGAAVLWAVQGSGPPGMATLILGPVGGFFWATSLIMWIGTMAKVGLALSTAVMRLSVLFPTLLSVILFAELPTGLQFTGVALTVVVLGLLGWNSLSGEGVRAREGGFVWLLGLLLLMGGVGIVQKLFAEWGRPVDRNALLFLVFTSAGLMCWWVVLRQRRRLRRGDALRGFLFGLGNVTSNSFLLLGLVDVPGVVAFPTLSVGVILTTSVTGLLLYRERPGWRGVSAIVLSAVSIVLMTSS